MALKGLYAYHIHERDIDRILADLTTDSDSNPDTVAFARRLMETVIANLAFLDKEIARLAEHWELDRIALIDLIIIRMALAEMRFMPDIPERVAINEAIDLSKEYSTLDSSSFVNGILDAALSGRPTDDS